MTQEENMTQMLTQLLETNETLLYPICGVFGKGKMSRSAYFGFTENHLLVVLPVDKQNAHALRIPLEISALRIKQNKIFRQYVIDISFATGAPCRITAYQKVLLLASQKENLPKFLQYLQSRPIVKPAIDPQKLGGEKLRRQYFVGFAAHLLLLATAILSMSFGISVLLEKESILTWMERIQITHPVWWVTPLVLLGLSVLNRFFVGKTVCTVCQDGLLVDGLLIRWAEIQKIEYEMEIARRDFFNEEKATVFARSFGEPEYAIKISGFPAFGLRMIRKFHPDITIETKRTSLIWAFALAVGVGALLPLISYWFA